MKAGARLNRRQFSRLLGGSSLGLLCSLRSAAARSGSPGRRTVEAALATGNLKVRAGLVIEILERHLETGYLSGAVPLIGRGANAEVAVTGNARTDAA